MKKNKNMISVLVVNLNNLEHTKNCINDLTNQDTKINITLVDQNSSEAGTEEFLLSLDNINIVQNKENLPLNHIWNRFVEHSQDPFVCFLNNDVRICPNFFSSSLEVFNKEPQVGFINHTTNKSEFFKWDDEVRYKIIDKVYRQGWDPIFRKECYHKIPEKLNFFFGDDYIYIKLYESGFKGAYILNSPMLHYERSTTSEKGGQRDANEDGEHFKKLFPSHPQISFCEEFSAWKPEFFKLEKFIPPNSYIQMINLAIDKYGFSKYLEIGVRDTESCFDKINCEHKDSVDPGAERLENLAKYKFTSDDFFNELSESNLDKDPEYKWDVIFIDGLHYADQVERDIHNSLNHLSDRGIIFVHDCNPPNEYYSRAYMYDFTTPAGGHWNGSVWKSFYKIRNSRTDLDACVVKDEWGTGVIKKGAQKIFKGGNPFFDWHIFDSHREKALNLIDPSEFNSWLDLPFYPKD